ncbi:MAG: endonuclease III, partial [Elusimicrobia bacterium]|nr:endonuclease III [Elusimicrobiota bacterium]
TDKRVNVVTPGLFKKYAGAGDYAGADARELEQEIRSTGFFRSKAASIRNACRLIAEKHGGQVPKTMEALLELPGVARKTANVVLGNAFGLAGGVVVDTHIKRLSYRMGLSEEKTPEKIEQDLMKLVPPKDWIWFSHAMIWHGRRVCKALSPDCPACALRGFCPKKGI